MEQQQSAEERAQAYLDEKHLLEGHTMETIHKAYFFKSEQDKKLKRAFILRWLVDKEKDRACFSIEPPSVNDDSITIVTRFPCAADGDFSDMVRMMKMMINPVEVVVE